jgi:hypothetical protein
MHGAIIERLFYTTHALKDKGCVKETGLSLACLHFGIGFELRCVLQILCERRPFVRDAVFLVGPLAEIYELASFGAERTVGIVLPLDWPITGWTLHRKRSKAKKREMGYGRRRPLLSSAPLTFDPSPWKILYAAASDSGRLMRILRLTKSMIPSRRSAFKRTVTLSRVEPTMEAISRCGSGMSINTPAVLCTP